MFRQLAIARGARDRDRRRRYERVQGARSPRRARRDGRRPRARDPQPARRDQGRRAAARRPPTASRVGAGRPRPPSSCRSSSRRSNRLNNVVTRFLDYARAERPGREGADKVDLNDVVRKTAQLLQQEPARRASSCACAPTINCRTSRGDPESLLQVFLNLGQNALQAMPDGGTLEILTTRRRALAPRLRPVLRGPVPRHRHRHPARPPQEAVHPVLHDEAEGHRPRPRNLATASSTSTAARSRCARRSARARRSRCSCPAAEPVPASKVEDITETGGLAPARRDADSADARRTAWTSGRGATRAEPAARVE